MATRVSNHVFGKYEKIRRIAQGGMGEVFLARQKGMAGFDRLVILKTLKGALAKEQGFVDQFLDEARVAATLNHPNIVSIYEVGQHEGIYFIAMEFIGGVDLAQLWVSAAKKKVGLPFQVSVQVAHDTALGLDHAHAAKDMSGKPLNVVHRDISPQNIMVRGDGVTKVVDFGIAKAQNRITQTAVGTVKGKLQYMSPEQVRGEPLSGKSDQFALGTVLWEMCTGKRLFKAKTEVDTLNKILQDPIPLPSDVVPNFPADLERVIARMLERDADKRYNSLQDAADHLRAYLEREGSGHGAVARFVRDVCGDDLDQVTEDLTPQLTQNRRAVKDDTLLDGAPATSLDPSDPSSMSSVNEPSFIRVRSSGAEARLDDENAMEQWVLDGKLSREDSMSLDGDVWMRLGDVPHLLPLFAKADRRRAEEIEAAVERELPVVHLDDDPQVLAQADDDPSPAFSLPQSQGFGAPRTQAPLQPFEAPAPALSQPPTPAQAGLLQGPSSMGAFPVNAPMSTGPMAGVAPVPSSGGTPPTGYASGQFEPFADEFQPYVAPKKASSAKLILGGVFVALVGAFGGLYFLAPATAKKMIAAVMPSTADVLPPALRTDHRATLRTALDAVSQQEPSVATHTALALLHANLASIDAEVARLVEVDDTAAAVKAAKDARASATAHRVKAYKAATAARSLDPTSTAASLAMATYQATRGAHSEMQADLDAIGNDGALRAEGDVVALSSRVHAALSESGDLGPLLDAARAARNTHPSDERVRYLLVALLVENAADAKGSKRKKSAWGEAEHELQRALLVHADDERYQLLRKRVPAHHRQKKAKPVVANAGDAKVVPGKKPAGSVDKGKSAVDTSTPDASASKPDHKTPDKTPDKADKPEKKEESFKTLLAAGKRAQKRGAPYRAVKLLQKALKKKSTGKGAIEARLSMGWAYVDMGKNRKAIASFEKVLDAAPRKSEAVFGLAEALRYDDQGKAAVRAYEQYLKMSPSGPDAAVARRAIKALK